MVATMKALAEAMQEKPAEMEFSPLVVVKVGSSKTQIENSSLAETILRAFNLKKEIESITPTYDEAKSHIINVARTFLDEYGTVNFEVKTPLGVIAVKVTFQYEAVIDPENVHAVREVLKDQFKALVRTKIKYVATKRLMEILCSADEPLAELLRPYIAVKEFGRSVQFKVK